MRNAITTAIRQSVFTVRFALGAVFIALLLFISSMDAVTEAFRAEEPLEYGFHGKFILEALDGDALAVCLPIVCALPYAASFVDDVKTGFLKLYIHRTSQRRYILGKAAGCLISGGAVIVLGLWLAYGLAAALFTPLEGPLAPNAADPEHAMTLLRNCGLIFLSGGFWSLFGLAISAFMQSKYIAYAAPFIFYYVLIILCERYFTSLYVVYPKAWLSPGAEWAMGRWGPALVIAELIGLAVLSFGAAVRKRVQGL